ncbi:MAG: glycosyltransferase [Cyclobacteriaceae bacterium]|nr:glycosyltransferase [Cyclobacteriaceae bacterium HetDA_MAG_MS6]
MIFLALFSAMHIVFFLVLRREWLRVPFHPSDSLEKEKSGFVSVLIPIRNEGQNIFYLLQDLSKQDYPGGFEVLVIDDHSSDRSRDEIERAMRDFDLDIRLLHLGAEQGKKAAATFGVRQAKGDIILCTDGDCRLKSGWMSSFISFFNAKGVQMATGPVEMVGKGFFAKLQSLEFASLIAFGAASLQLRQPSTGNGANMGYRKRAFLEVNGYEGNEQIPSGDDEFLLQKIYNAFDGSVGFVKSQRAIVKTDVKDDVKSFFNQRTRWSSKWRFHKSLFIKGSAILIFLDFLVYLILLGLVIAIPDDSVIASLLILGRWLAGSAYLKSASDFFALSTNTLHILAMLLIYPIYVIVLGFASIFGRYSWKDRIY